ncbi:MAG: hypothetical protein ABW189_04795 [Rickettsiales bacterium]
MASHDDLPVGRVLRLLAICPLSLKEENSQMQREACDAARRLLGKSPPKTITIRTVTGETLQQAPKPDASTSPLSDEQKNMTVHIIGFIEEDFEILEDLTLCLNAARNIPCRSFNENEIKKLEEFSNDTNVSTIFAMEAFNRLNAFGFSSVNLINYHLLGEIYHAMLSLDPSPETALPASFSHWTDALKTAYAIISPLKARSDFKTLLIRDVGIARATASEFIGIETDNIIIGCRQAGHLTKFLKELEQSPTHDKNMLNAEFLGMVAGFLNKMSSALSGAGSTPLRPQSKTQRPSYFWKKLKEAAEAYGLTENKGDSHYALMLLLASDSCIDSEKSKGYTQILECVRLNKDIPTDNATLCLAASAFKQARDDVDSLYALPIAENWSDDTLIANVDVQNLPGYACLAKIIAFEETKKQCTDLLIKQAIDYGLLFYTRVQDDSMKKAQRAFALFPENIRQQAESCQISAETPESLEDKSVEEGNMTSNIDWCANVIAYLTHYSDQGLWQGEQLSMAFNVIVECQELIKRSEFHRLFIDCIRQITQETTEWAEEIMPMQQKGKGKRKAQDSTIAECLDAFAHSPQKIFILNALCVICNKIEKIEKEKEESGSVSQDASQDSFALTEQEMAWVHGGPVPAVNRGSASGTSNSNDIAAKAAAIGMSVDEYLEALAAEQSLAQRQ